MKESYKAHASLLVTALIYGANYTIAKGVMPAYIEPFGFILLRISGAVLLFWLTGLFYPEKIEKKDLSLFAVCALFGVAMNQMLFFKGLSMTTPINAAIIMVVTPLLVILIAAALVKEKITLRKSFGVVIGLIGACVLLLVKHDLSFGSLTWRGDLCVFINAIFWGIYLVIARPLILKYKAITVLKWLFLFAFCYVFPFGFGELKRVAFFDMPQEALFSVAFVVIGTTYFAYLMNNYALQKVGPAVVSIYIYLQPLIAAAIAILSGKDALESTKIISAALIFTGLYLVSSSAKKIPAK